MPPEFDPHLEALVDAELKKLPPVSAPPSLAPQVMSLLHARARQPWWHRVWWDWPLAAKAASLVGALVLVGMFGGGSAWLNAGFNGDADAAIQSVDETAPFGGVLAAFAGAGQLLWDNLGRPYLLYVAALAAAAYVVCIGASTMFIRVAVRRN